MTDKWVIGSIVSKKETAAYLEKFLADKGFDGKLKALYKMPHQIKNSEFSFEKPPPEGFDFYFMQLTRKVDKEEAVNFWDGFHGYTMHDTKHFKISRIRKNRPSDASRAWKSFDTNFLQADNFKLPILLKRKQEVKNSSEHIQEITSFEPNIIKRFNIKSIGGLFENVNLYIQDQPMHQSEPRPQAQVQIVYSKAFQELSEEVKHIAQVVNIKASQEVLKEVKTIKHIIDSPTEYQELRKDIESISDKLLTLEQNRQLDRESIESNMNKIKQVIEASEEATNNLRIQTEEFSKNFTKEELVKKFRGINNA